MKYPISARYGDTLFVAAEKAVVQYAKDAALMAEIRQHPRFVFDFHGIEVPMTSETTVEALVAEVAAEMNNRADLYEQLPLSLEPWLKEQGGKMGEHLTEAVVPAIQCGMLWGNRVFTEKPLEFERLRHVFEFNGIKVPFNPWKDGECQRVLVEVEAQLKQRAGSAATPVVTC